MNQKKNRTSSSNEIIQNRRVKFDYFIENQFEAGMVLEGWEVKSLRAKKVQLVGSFVIAQSSELFLAGSQIVPLPTASTHIKPKIERLRKLLLNRREINQIISSIRQKGYSCVCLSLYWSQGKAKAKIALVQGKKKHDKRAQSKSDDWAREQQRLMKQQAVKPLKN